MSDEYILKLHNVAAWRHPLLFHHGYKVRLKESGHSDRDHAISSLVTQRSEDEFTDDGWTPCSILQIRNKFLVGFLCKPQVVFLEIRDTFLVFCTVLFLEIRNTFLSFFKPRAWNQKQVLAVFWNPMYLVLFEIRNKFLPFSKPRVVLLEIRNTFLLFSEPPCT